MAGQMVYLAMYRLARTLSAGPSPGRAPRRAFITCAVCHVRSGTSPIRPIA
jgi:cytochrome c553